MKMKDALNSLRNERDEAEKEYTEQFERYYEELVEKVIEMQSEIPNDESPLIILMVFGAILDGLLLLAETTDKEKGMELRALVASLLIEGKVVD